MNYDLVARRITWITLAITVVLVLSWPVYWHYANANKAENIFRESYVSAFSHFGVAMEMLSQLPDRVDLSNKEQSRIYSIVCTQVQLGQSSLLAANGVAVNYLGFGLSRLLLWAAEYNFDNMPLGTLREDMAQILMVGKRTINDKGMVNFPVLKKYERTGTLD